MAHEAGTVLDDQDAVAELDGLGDLATLDQLRLRLEQAEELLVVGDRLLGEHAATGLVTGMNRHIHEVEQLRPEPLDARLAGPGLIEIHAGSSNSVARAMIRSAVSSKAR